MPRGKRWTRDELTIALGIYHNLTFGQLHAKQAVIVELAEKLGRGANSVAMKLCNFASLDPALKMRGIKGLEGASALDREVWADFHGNPEEVVPESREGLRVLFGAKPEEDLEVIPKQGIRVRKKPVGETEVLLTAKQRRGQDYFRDAVLNNFGGCCGVTGMPIREFLVASHILPWRSHPEERLNVRNGLCLSRLHDAAFDRGFIAFDDDLGLMVSPALSAHFPQRAVAENFKAYAGETLAIPADGVLPDPAFLAMHRSSIFIKG
ncbi:HNH endonuclease [Luteolibacter sp. GHJ8]|uniref:HNH endonuclease n=1 Tax=Luteolibacter rhizosphaerae TaxID=2989719 RepID=A0ABT3GB84_9BACT|nr:HNH endonuclease [Luteolibacter rhizosphaerae]MCW1917095.1 HNH endonuclease [Luteolibacter rhizosphaerae]